MKPEERETSWKNQAWPWAQRPRKKKRDPIFTARKASFQLSPRKQATAESRPTPTTHHLPHLTESPSSDATSAGQINPRPEGAAFGQAERGWEKWERKEKDGRGEWEVAQTFSVFTFLASPHLTETPPLRFYRPAAPPPRIDSRRRDPLAPRTGRDRGGRTKRPLAPRGARRRSVRRRAVSILLLLLNLDGVARAPQCQLKGIVAVASYGGGWRSMTGGPNRPPPRRAPPRVPWTRSPEPRSASPVTSRQERAQDVLTGIYRLPRDAVFHRAARAGWPTRHGHLWHVPSKRGPPVIDCRARAEPVASVETDSSRPFQLTPC
jgi:hypothetical protein